ncbi:FG-GAP repeat protein [Streptomyces sp. NPDC051907]|uniref:FG-GAP repeat protein n=1 Tax=Streptomyces sp. NPDC051907 TaxID=3155284 RepID=UPI00342F39E4
MNRSRNGRGFATAVAIAVAAAATATAAPSAHAAPSAPTAGTAAVDAQRIDFNGDGRQDLAVGAPDGTIAGAAKSGYVSVVYGRGAQGLDPAVHATFSQNTAGVPGAAEKEDRFGAAVHPADLNADGYTDLVVGAPGEDVGNATDAGMLTILWGSAAGLSTATAVDTGADPGWGVGGYVTAGDYDDDGVVELVARAGGEKLRFLSGIGKDGKPAKATLMYLWPVEGVVATHNLTTGDVTGDGVSDLVMIHTDAEEEDSWRGVLYKGGKGGLTRVGILEDTAGYRLGGQSAAIGDLNKDGYGDIVMGHGRDYYDSDWGKPTKGGALGVAYGGPDGLSTTLKPVWIHQDTEGVPGVSESGDGMGTSVSVADVDADGYADVVTGVPFEDFAGLTDPGAFLILKGSAKGLTGAGSQVYSQETADVPGVAEKGDRFGETVAVLRAAAGEGAQVVVGAPAENAGNGAVWALRSSAAGPTTAGSVSFGPGTMGAPATGAAFGGALGKR